MHLDSTTNNLDTTGISILKSIGTIYKKVRQAKFLDALGRFDPISVLKLHIVTDIKVKQ